MTRACSAPASGGSPSVTCGQKPKVFPFDRIVALAARHGVPVVAPEMGQRVDLRQPVAGQARWLNVVEREMTKAPRKRATCLAKPGLGS